MEVSLGLFFVVWKFIHYIYTCLFVIFCVYYSLKYLEPIYPVTQDFTFVVFVLSEIYATRN